MMSEEHHKIALSKIIEMSNDMELISETLEKMKVHGRFIGNKIELPIDALAKIISGIK